MGSPLHPSAKRKATKVLFPESRIADHSIADRSLPRVCITRVGNERASPFLQPHSQRQGLHEWPPLFENMNRACTNRPYSTQCSPFSSSNSARDWQEDSGRRPMGRAGVAPGMEARTRRCRGGLRHPHTNQRAQQHNDHQTAQKHRPLHTGADVALDTAHLILG